MAPSSYMDGVFSLYCERSCRKSWGLCDLDENWYPPAWGVSSRETLDKPHTKNLITSVLLSDPPLDKQKLGPSLSLSFSFLPRSLAIAYMNVWQFHSNRRMVSWNYYSFCEHSTTSTIKRKFQLWSWTNQVLWHDDPTSAGLWVVSPVCSLCFSARYSPCVDYWRSTAHNPWVSNRRALLTPEETETSQLLICSISHWCRFFFTPNSLPSTSRHGLTIDSYRRSPCKGNRIKRGAKEMLR